MKPLFRPLYFTSLSASAVFFSLGLRLGFAAEPTRVSSVKTNGNSAVDVTVSAEHSSSSADQKPGSFSTISATELERTGASDMAAVVRCEPFVTAPFSANGTGNLWDGTGYSGYNIRGVEGNRVSLDVDGIPMPDAAPKPDGSTANSFGLGRDYADPETARSVEISSGMSNATRNNPGLGGGVSFVTKSPSGHLVAGGRPYDADYKLGYASVNESLAHTVTAAAQARAERQVQPGFNAYASVSLRF